MSWFDAKNESSQLVDTSIFEPGWYDFYVTNCEVKTDKKNNEYIAFEFTVMSGARKSRKLWENIYLSHEFEWLESKSRAILKGLCDAKGIAALKGPSDIYQFKGAEYKIRLGVYKNKDTGVERNTIQKIEPANTETESDVPF